MKALVVFHRVDFDGLFSFATAKRALEIEGYEVEAFGFNYNDQVEMPDFSVFDKIVMCDISFPVPVMKELKDKYASKVVWIDHHITAINDSIANGYDSLEGVRVDGTAACVLTFKYFNECSYDDIPYAIRLAGANDVWDHETYDWENEVQPLQYGLSLVVAMNSDKMYEVYDDIIENPEIYINKGLDIKTYNESLYESWCKRFSFEVEVGPGLKGIAMLCPVFTSKIFKSISENYDVCVVAEKSGQQEGVYNVSMYSDKHMDLGFSCGAYMKENYGGGGHAGAAGGFLNIDQFVRLLTEHTI